MNNVILIGFMGSGKSSIGRKLSYRLQRTFIDTDKQIEREQDVSIREIFAQSGEEAFRKMETVYLEELLDNCRNQIISTGGGLPLRKKNRKLIQALGCVVYLRVTADTIYERLKNDTTRPLLQGDAPKEKINTLLKQRVAIYESVADLVIDVDNKGFDEILDEIQEGVKEYEAISN